KKYNEASKNFREVLNIKSKLRLDHHDTQTTFKNIQNMQKGNALNKPIHTAASNGDKNMVEDLLKNGANINTYDSLGHRTPLHFASEGGYLNIVNILLKNGSNIETTDINGQTPLHYAVHNNHKEIGKALLEKG